MGGAVGMLVRLSEAQGRVLAQTNPETLIPLLLLLYTGTEKASVLSLLRSGICKHSVAHTNIAKSTMSLCVA